MRNKIKSFVERKYEQTDSFERGIEDRYGERFGGNDREMGDKFTKYAYKHGWDSVDNGEWRKNNLTSQEQDYYDYQTKNNRL